MAFADPQSVNDGSAHSLARTGQGLDSGAFRNTTDGFEMKISHSYGKRVRHEIRLDQTKIVADPLFAANNIPVGASVYLVVNHPNSGFTPAQLVSLTTALLGNLTASTNANLTKLVGGES